MIQITLISNILFEPYMKRDIKKVFEQKGFVANINYLPYADDLCIVEAIKDVDIVVVCLNFEEMYPDVGSVFDTGGYSDKEILNITIQKCKKLYDWLKSNGDFLVLWFGFEDYYDKRSTVFGNLYFLGGLVDRINLSLREMLVGEDVMIDLKRLIAKVGVEDAYVSKGKYRWNAPYSNNIVFAVAEEILRQYCCYIGKTKKCIVLDCDNVLWGGVLSEDGIEGISLGGTNGRFFQDFQRFLLNLYCHGVILTVCSKNDEEDVLRVFREHSGMILREEHVACFKVNWTEKPQNVEEISNELGIGLDSMVFIDDSSFEVRMMQDMVPEVTSFLFHRDSIYQQLSCFYLKNKCDYEQIKKRNETYHTNAQRKYLKREFMSTREYLSALEVETDIHPMRTDEIARVAELTQRANRCTNGVRYNIEQLKQKTFLPEYCIYVVTVKDKFSDLGLVGAIGIHQKELDMFVLSCRALGMGVEENMLELLVRMKIQTYVFKDTGKNSELKERISVLILT